jgi:hypothetical protein
MHAVLAAAIANPRFAGEYGSDRGDYDHFAGSRGVDTYLKSVITRWDGRRGLNDNETSYQPPRL